MNNHLQNLELIKKEYIENINNPSLKYYNQKLLLFSFFEIFSKTKEHYLIENIKPLKRFSKFIFYELKKKNFLK